MKNLSPILKGISICLTSILFTSSIGYASGISLPNKNPSCGEWNIQDVNLAKDQRIGITMLEEATGDDCSQKFLLSNKTGIYVDDISLGGGYTMGLQTEQSNADVQFMLMNDPFISLLPVGVDIDLKATPKDITNQSTINIQGNLSIVAFTWDLAFFLLKIKLSSVGIACVIPTDQIFQASIRSAPALYGTAQFAFNGDFVESRNELSKIIDIFYEKAFAALESAGVKCSLSELLEKTVSSKAKILWAYLTWMPIIIFDYLEYDGQSAIITLTYSPPALTLPSSDIWIAFENQNNIWLIHPDQKGLTQISNNQNDSQRLLNFKWSPDGNSIAYSLNTQSGNTAILLYDIQTSTTRTLLSDAVGGNFDWSLTGKQIIYDTPSTGDFPSDQRNKGIWVINLDSGKIRQIVKPPKDYPLITSPKWSSEGSHVIFTVPCFEVNCVSYGVANFQSGKSIILPVYGGTCEWSPIDLRIACTTAITDNSSGKVSQEIVILDVTGRILEKVPVLDSARTVVRIVWLPDGTKLALGYYSDGKGQTDILSLETGERLALAPGIPSGWSPNGEWLLTWKSELNATPTISFVNSNFGEIIFLSEGLEAIWQP